MFFSFDAICQVGWDVVVDGAVFKGNKELGGAVVTLFENSVEVDEIITSGDGVFNFALLPGNDYLIVIAKPGYVSKRMSITMTDLPMEDTRVTFLPWITFDLSLFENIEGLDVSVLDKPVAKWVYDEKEDAFVHDEEYAKSIRTERERFIKAFQQKQEENYNALIIKADSAFSAKAYLIAKSAYRKALTIKLDKKFLKDKIEEIDKILIIVREEKYNTAVAEADNAFNAKDYENAKAAYLDAITNKPNVAYPKEKIKEIDEILAANKKEKYNAAIAKADNAFDTEDYQNAKKLYRVASAIKPDEMYPKDKMKNIYKILVTKAETDADRNKRERYKTSIAKADKAFNAKYYQKAKRLYQEILTIKQNQKLEDKIDKINTILETMRAEAKPKSKVKVKKKHLSEEEKYNTAMAKADKAFEEQNYLLAKMMFQSALAIKPDDKYQQDKIKEIEVILAAIKAEEDSKNREVNVKSKANAIAATEKESERQTVEMRIKAEEAKRNKKEAEKLLADEEKKKLFLYELYKKYDPGVTKEIIVDEKKKIIRIIVVKDAEANEYKKIIYSWGGVYYKKNGEDIEKYIFETETKK